MVRGSCSNRGGRWGRTLVTASGRCSSTTGRMLNIAENSKSGGWGCKPVSQLAQYYCTQNAPVGSASCRVVHTEAILGPAFLIIGSRAIGKWPAKPGDQDSF